MSETNHTPAKQPESQQPKPDNLIYETEDETESRVLQERFFPTIADDDVVDALLYARKRNLDVWAGHVFAESRVDRTRPSSYLYIGPTLYGLLALAHATGLFAGMDDVKVIRDDEGKLIEVQATVYRRPWSRASVRDAYSYTATNDFGHYTDEDCDHDRELRLCRRARKGAIKLAFQSPVEESGDEEIPPPAKLLEAFKSKVRDELARHSTVAGFTVNDLDSAFDAAAAALITSDAVGIMNAGDRPEEPGQALDDAPYVDDTGVDAYLGFVVDPDEGAHPLENPKRNDIT